MLALGNESPEIVAEVLQCSQCAGKLSVAADGLVCFRCGDRIPVEDGIIDFVRGSSRTKLDDIDYDAFYRVNKDASLAQASTLIDQAGAWWPITLGRTLEIGAGTGGATMGLVAKAAMSDLVVTDVSSKMLRLCRRNLQNAGLLRRDTMFVTYGATQSCFQPGSFDTAIGSAVLHHIADFKAFLAEVSKLLKPNGRAFFIEPALPFHRELVAALADIIAELTSDGIAFDDPGVVRIVNWIAEVECNIAHHECLEFLSSREDKHLFIRSEIEEIAGAAGFARVAVIPFGIDPTGEPTLRTYLNLCQIDQTLVDRVCQVLPHCWTKYLSQLKPEDCSPSYLFCFQNGSSMQQGKWEPRFHFNLERSDKGVKIEGWCMASAPLAWVLAEAAGQTHKLPIWRPRPDVQARANRDAPYPAVNALCSGVSEEIECPKIAMVPEIILSAVTTTGVRLPLGRFSVGRPTMSNNDTASSKLPVGRPPTTATRCS
jgi:ubiquinone/menaquinone biosynthesis C-methylase UbiE